MSKRKQRKAHEAELRMKSECTQHLDEREISEREKFKRIWLKDHDDLREGLKKIPDLSPQVVNVAGIVIDAQTARAIMKATGVPFACVRETLARRSARVLRGLVDPDVRLVFGEIDAPRAREITAASVRKIIAVKFTTEELAALLMQALRRYAVDQQQNETVNRIAHGDAPLSRKRIQELLEVPTSAFKAQRIRRVPGTEEEERELLKVLNSGPTPYDPETSGYDWYSPATDRMNAFEREELGILNAKPDKKTKKRTRKLLDKTPEDKGGRPENWALRSLVLRLADIYEDCTGRKAGASINRTGDIVGPFVRFAATVIDPSDPYLPRAVLAALQARKKVQ